MGLKNFKDSFFERMIAGIVLLVFVFIAWVIIRIGHIVMQSLRNS